ASRLRLVALVHLPLALEMGLDAGLARRFEASERRALATARQVIVTGRSTVGVLADYGVAADRIVVVTPGTDRRPLARGGEGETLRLSCVATLSPGKGHALLFRALASIEARNWTLTCVGNPRRHPATAESLRQLVRELGLDDCVEFAGELRSEALAEC